MRLRTWYRIGTVAMLLSGIVNIIDYVAPRPRPTPAADGVQVCYSGRAESKYVVAKVQTEDGGEVQMSFPISEAKCGAR